MQCGLSLSEGQDKMQEDLATLFSRNLTLATPTQPSLSSLDSAAHAEQRPLQPITYITQHYHHSAHVVPSTASPNGSSTSPFTTDIDQSSPAVILTQHDIDPSTLFPSQLTLFQQADPEQRLRLVQLWRISPPDYGGHALAQELGNWPPTSLQQEEEMAGLRYQRKLLAENKLQGRERPNDMDQDCKAHMVGLGDGDGRPSAEPYMMSGYETLARRDYNTQAQEQQQLEESVDPYHARPSTHDGHYDRATDPVYQGQQWWHNFMGGQAMENQYGAFDQLNQFGLQPGNVLGTTGPEDEEML